MDHGGAVVPELAEYFAIFPKDDVNGYCRFARYALFGLVGFGAAIVGAVNLIGSSGEWGIALRAQP